MKRFRKVYLEISNVCNLKCNFCPGTKRQKHMMPQEDFSAILEKLRPYTDFLYFHLMGEPLCHPNLETYLSLAGNAGFKVILTTNGTLLKCKQEILLNSPALHKINISLHAFEANELSVPFSEYLTDCFSFGKAAEGKIIVSYRLWNQGGADKKNQEILDALAEYSPQPWTGERHGKRLGNKIYLEYGDKFDWPDLSAPEHSEVSFCYGLRDQIGVLCDGTVVPCCLDHEGDIPLGNLLTENVNAILRKPRAKAIFDGFSKGKVSEELCRHCGYATRFTK